MRRYGLIGWPLGHSFSQGWFSRMFHERGITGCVYENYPLESIDGLPALLRQHPDLYGFNVTIPHKEAILPYLDELDPQAAAVGAVNCAKVTRESGKIYLKGYNTDVYGFERSLFGMLGEKRPSALVLGTGGASKAVRFVLAHAGIAFQAVSRQGGGERLSYGELTPELVARTPLIINTTPLGMSPHTDARPAIPYDAVGPGHFLYDLVYNPAETAFLRAGRRHGATVMNGYAMLVAQAEKSWEIWNEDQSAVAV